MAADPIQRPFMWATLAAGVAIGAAAATHGLLALALFLAAAIIIAALAGRMRQQARDRVKARAATETERARNTLLASISHDFRRPLDSILGSVTSLIDYGNVLAPAAQRDLLGQIKDETEGLDFMVRNLLVMTRIDAGMLELRKDATDLRDVVQRAVNAARRRGAMQGIEIGLPADLPPMQADAAMVEQALANVVGNAVAHTPKEARILVDAVVTPGAIALRVTDDGPGIPPDVLPHVFDKFVRGPAASAVQAGDGEGAGLGLAIARGIVEAHGGTVTATSPVAQGPGTRIVMTFPVAAAP